MLTAGRQDRRGHGREHLRRLRQALITPPIVDGVLAGLTRDAVITIARDEGYEVVE